MEIKREANGGQPATNSGNGLARAARRLGFFTAALALVFCVPLFRLGALSLKEDLYSHVLLMPFVSIYLVWMTRHRLPAVASSSRGGTILFAGAGVIALTAWAVFMAQGKHLPSNDSQRAVGPLVSPVLRGSYASEHV